MFGRFAYKLHLVSDWCFLIVNLHLLSTASGCFFLLLQIFLLLFRQLLLLLLLTAFTPSRAHVVLLLVLFVVLLVVLLLSATCFPCVPPGPRRNKLLCKEVLLPRKHLARPFDGPGGLGLGLGQGFRWWGIWDYGLGIGKVRGAGDVKIRQLWGKVSA